MAERFSLANKKHLSLVLMLLVGSGAMCDKCGTGTRRTSKRWAKCKNPKCGQRVERRSMDDAGTLLSEQRPSAASGMRAGCPADAAPSPAGRSSKAEDRR